MEGGAFLKPEVAKLAEKFVLYCNITSQVPGAKDQGLIAEKGGGGAYPYIAFLDTDGALLLKHESERTIERFLETGGKVVNFFDLRSKAGTGGPAVKVEYILAQLELGLLKPGDAEVKIRETGGRLTDEQEKKFDAFAANFEIETAVRGIRRDDPRGKLDVAKKFHDRYKAGKAAPSADPWMSLYWNLILEYAESIQDTATFEVSLNLLKAKHGAMPELKRYFDEKEATLKRLKEGRK